MTWNQFVNLVLTNFPNAEIGEDNDGQLIIHTNLTTKPDPKPFGTPTVIEMDGNN